MSQHAPVGKDLGEASSAAQQPTELEGVPNSVAAPLTLREKASNAFFDSIPWVGCLVLASGSVLFVFVFLVSLPQWNKLDLAGRTWTATLTALAYAFTCLSPLLLNGGVGLLMRRTKRARVGRDGTLPPTPPHVVKRLGREALVGAELEWKYFREFAETTNERTLHYGVIFGGLATLVLAGVAWIAGETLAFGSQLLPPPSSTRIDAAYAVGAATVVCVLRDFARFIVRAAARDGSARLFAWAGRRMILTLLAVFGLLAALNLKVLSLDSLVKTRFSWGALGIASAIVGERMLDFVADKLTAWFGAVPMKKGAENDLHLLDGMTTDDILRLEEEGITTLHKLALQATPRLYFQLPYSMRELIDWQDQATLLDHFGPARAGYIRSTGCTRHITDIWEDADCFFRDGTTEEMREAIIHRMGFANRMDAVHALSHIHQDGGVTRLVLLRAAFSPGLKETSS